MLSIFGIVIIFNKPQIIEALRNAEYEDEELDKSEIEGVKKSKEQIKNGEFRDFDDYMREKEDWSTKFFKKTYERKCLALITFPLRSLRNLRNLNVNLFSNS